MGHKSRRIVWWVFVLALVSTLIALLVLRRTGSRVAVTISKETTYIIEPLREDGYPDYVAALNNRMSEGVTPENNASVLLWQAIGPGEINANDREKYFQMLGIPPLPENGDYYITPDKYLARRKDPRNRRASGRMKTNTAESGTSWNWP